MKEIPFGWQNVPVHLCEILSFLFISAFYVFRRGNSQANARMPSGDRMRITPTTTTGLPISINDIEDLLHNVPTTTRRGKTATGRSKSTTPAASNNVDDSDFLRQVVSFSQSPD